MTVTYSAIRTATVSGNWNSTATWGGSSVPGSGDIVTINSGITVTLTANASCASLTFAAGNNSALTINGTNSLTVVGSISMPRPANTNPKTFTINVNAGSLTCGSLTMSATTTGRNDIINITTGSLTVTGTLTTGTTGCQINISGGGSMTLGGAVTTSPVLTLAASSTVNYTAAVAQTVIPATYGNLTCSGTGAKNIASTKSVSVAGNFVNSSVFVVNEGTSTTSTWFSIAGGFTNSGTFTETGPLYSRFVLNGSTAQIINNTGTVTPGLCEFGVANVAGVTINSTSQIIVASANLFYGTVANSNKLTIGTGGSSAPTIQRGVLSNTNPAGSFDVSPVFDIGSGGLALYYDNGSVAYNVGFEVPPTSSVAYFIVFDAADVALNSDLTISNELNFYGGTGTPTLRIGAHTLTIDGVITYTVAGSFIGGTSSNLIMNGSTTVNTITGGLNNFTINAATTLGGPNTVSGTLSMTSGILTTTATNLISVTNTSSTAISGGSATSFINGPVKWTLPSNLSSGSIYNVPVGNSTYLPFALVNPTTGSGAVTVQVQAFSASCGGTAGGTLSSLSSTEYWSLAISGNFGNSSLSLSRQSTIYPLNSIGGCTTKTGTYTSLDGDGESFGVTNSTSIGTKLFFALATRPCSAPSGGSVSGVTSVCSGTTGVTYTYSGGAPVANSWSWSVPAGATITAGQGTASVTVTFGNTSGNVTCTPRYNGCAGASIVKTVTVNPIPTAVVVTPASATICEGEIQTLGANSSVLQTILSENFNGATNTWTKINNSTGGTPSLAAWTLRPNAYVYSTYGTWYSNDNSQFYLSNSDEAGSGVAASTILQSPSFSTIGYSSVSLNFWHYLRWLSSSAKVDYSIDGTTWINLKTYTNSVGSVNAFSQENISLPSGALNQASVYVRFKYDAGWDYFWGIDNVSITGSYDLSSTWSPTTGLYTDAGATIAYSGTPVATIYAKPTNSVTYVATATSSGGCTNSGSSVITVNPIPSNDLCANATTISSFPYNSGAQSTLCATDDIPAFGASSCTSHNKNLWFKFTGNGSPFLVSTCDGSTNFDTEIHVYTGSCGSMTEVICNDDGIDAGCGGGKSSLTFCSTNSVVYYISVGGFQTGAAGGNFVLNVQEKQIAAATITTNSVCGNGTVTLTANVGTNGDGVDFSIDGGVTVAGTDNSSPYQYTTSSLTAPSFVTVHVRSINSNGCVGQWVNSTQANAYENPSVTPQSLCNFEGMSRVEIVPSGGSSSYVQYEQQSPNILQATNRFSLPNSSTRAYRVTDSHGCNSSWTNYSSQAAPTQIAGSATSGTCLVRSDNSWWHVADGSNRVIVSINDNGNDLGDIVATSYIEPTTSMVGQAYYLKRHFKVSAEHTPSTNVVLRLYFTQGELDELITKSNSNSYTYDDVNTISDLKVTRYSGPNEDGDYLNNDFSTPTNFTVYAPTTGVPSTPSLGADVRYVEISVPGFSEEWIHGGKDNVSMLPVELVSFVPTCLNNQVLVRWVTASEVNNSHFLLQRSVNGVDFSTIAKINGSGNSNSLIEYSYIDHAISATQSYYRLVQVDFDGTEKIYDPKSVSCDQVKEALSAYPNPFTDKVSISGLSDGLYVFEIVNAFGQVVSKSSAEVNDKTDLDLSTLTPGIYLVKITDSTGNFQQISIVKK
jgi:hypothetical protein